MHRVDFLGIGALKAATTTLYLLLKEHPQVCFPKHIKEVQFFDRYFERGPEWYHNLFEPTVEQVCGEITPNYIYEPLCPQRIAGMLPDVKMILLLRDPIRRIYSQYTHFRQQSYYRGDFSTFLTEHPNAIDRSLYHQQLSRFFDHFAREQVQVILFENFVSQPEQTVADIYRFIGVDDRFRPPRRQSSPSSVPRLPWLYSMGSRTMTLLYHYQLAPVVAAIKRTGIQKWMLSEAVDRSAFPPMSEDDRKRLVDIINPDMAALEAELKFDLRRIWDLGAPITRGDSQGGDTGSFQNVDQTNVTVSSL